MIDLLVHLAAKSKVSPSGHTLQILDEEKGKSLDYTPNQTIGSLGAITVYLVPKNKKPDWNKANKAVFEVIRGPALSPLQNKKKLAEQRLAIGFREHV